MRMQTRVSPKVWVFAISALGVIAGSLVFYGFFVENPTEESILTRTVHHSAGNTTKKLENVTLNPNTTLDAVNANMNATTLNVTSSPNPTVTCPTPTEQAAVKDMETQLKSLKEYQSVMEQNITITSTLFTQLFSLWQRMFKVWGGKSQLLAERTFEAKHGLYVDDNPASLEKLKERIENEIPPNCRRNVAMCTIIKNEGPYLQEWLAFHILNGVGQVFLYVNDEDKLQKEFTMRAIEPFKKLGWVTVIDWPTKASQYATYNHCINNIKQNALQTFDWVFIIDADEFVWVTDKPVQYHCIGEYLNQNFPNAPGIHAYWYTFAGHADESQSDKLSMESYHLRIPQMNLWNSLVRPQFYKQALDPHTCEYVDGKQPVSTDGVTVTKDTKPMYQKLAVNHYFTRSLEEYMNKVTRGLADGPGRRTIHEFRAHENAAIEHNTDSHAFLPKLKCVLGLQPCTSTGSPKT